MSVNIDEFKSLVGLDEVHFAMVTRDDADEYTAEAPEWLAPAISATGEPTTSEETQYADNKPWDIFVSEGVTKLTLDTTNIPIPTLARILGKTFDVATGRMLDEGSESTPPDVALSFRSMKSNGKFRYFQYLKGRFSVPKDEAATATDKREAKPSQIVFTAMNTVHKWTIGGKDKSIKRIVGDEDTENFDGSNWFVQVQVPGVSTPSALALSGSDPADGAPSVTLDKKPSLTFNNKLKSDAPKRVVFSVDDGEAVEFIAALDATGKTITITPEDPLTASTTYLVAFAVTDIYGQDLVGVIDFTTGTGS